jgi:hypothetical protein
MSLSTLIAQVPTRTVAEVRADDIPALCETRLPDEWSRAYSLRLQGMPAGEIAEKFGVCRESIWRWCKAIEKEYLDYLEKNPQFNIVGEQFKRLRDLEEENRKAATAAKSERAKAMFLANAMKAITAQNDLLLDVGIFERAPERLFKVVATVKPIDPQELESKASNRTREEIVSELIDRLGRSTQL